MRRKINLGFQDVQFHDVVMSHGLEMPGLVWLEVRVRSPWMASPVTHIPGIRTWGCWNGLSEVGLKRAPYLGAYKFVLSINTCSFPPLATIVSLLEDKQAYQIQQKDAHPDQPTESRLHASVSAEPPT